MVGDEANDGLGLKVFLDGVRSKPLPGYVAGLGITSYSATSAERRLTCYSRQETGDVICMPVSGFGEPRRAASATLIRWQISDLI